MDVKPFTASVISAINIFEVNTIEYQAYLYNYTIGKFQLPQRHQTGYIIMSSNLVFYYDQWKVDTTTLLSDQKNRKFYIFGYDDRVIMMLVIVTLLILLTLSLMMICCVLRLKSSYTPLPPSVPLEETTTECQSHILIRNQLQQELLTSHTLPQVVSKVNTHSSRSLSNPYRNISIDVDDYDSYHLISKGQVT